MPRFYFFRGCTLGHQRYPPHQMMCNSKFNYTQFISAISVFSLCKKNAFIYILLSSSWMSILRGVIRPIGEELHSAMKRELSGSFLGASWQRRTIGRTTTVCKLSQAETGTPHSCTLETCRPGSEEQSGPPASPQIDRRPITNLDAEVQCPDALLDGISARRLI